MAIALQRSVLRSKRTSGRLRSQSATAKGRDRIQVWTLQKSAPRAQHGAMGPGMPALTSDRIRETILFVRGEKTMLDAKLAALYGVPTKALVQAVKRNALRFPDDFMFQLTRAESMALRSRSVTSKSRVGRGGLRYRPYAFTEQGVAMLSSVLRSERAIQVNIVIVRTFVRLRRMLASQPDLERKVDALERKYDGQFKVVFDAIRALMAPEPRPTRRIGFRPDDGERHEDLHAPHSPTSPSAARRPPPARDTTPPPSGTASSARRTRAAPSAWAACGARRRGGSPRARRSLPPAARRAGRA